MELPPPRSVDYALHPALYRKLVRGYHYVLVGAVLDQKAVARSPLWYRSLTVLPAHLRGAPMISPFPELSPLRPSAAHRPLYLLPTILCVV